MKEFLNKNSIIRRFPSLEENALTRTYEIIHEGFNAVSNKFCNTFVNSITKAYGMKIAKMISILDLENEAQVGIINVEGNFGVDKYRVAEIQNRFANNIPISLIEDRVKAFRTRSLVRLEGMDSIKYLTVPKSIVKVGKVFSMSRGRSKVWMVE